MVDTPKVYIPTGYESQRRSIERRQQLANSLLQAGLQQNNGMTSWAQVLGQLGQALAGKIALNRADKREDALNTQIKQDYTNRVGAFNADIARQPDIDPQVIVSKYGSDPFLEESVKPYREALAAGLKERQQFVQDGDTWRRKGDLTPGQPVGARRNDFVIPTPDGGMAVNPVRVTAAAMANGAAVPTNGFQISTPGPGALPPMAAGAPVPQSAPPMTKAPPPVGSVQQGYVFMGGDPASPNSWRPQ